MLALLLAALPAPVVTLEARGVDGCGVVKVNGARVTGAAPGLCVKQAVWTSLEGGLVALLVEAPHRFDARPRHRVFLYRLVGRRLEPRFLGSGFRTRSVDRLVPLEGALGVEVSSDAGYETMRCRFLEFPLVCEKAP
jgi:hypothetical protein